MQTEEDESSDILELGFILVCAWDWEDWVQTHVKLMRWTCRYWIGNRYARSCSLSQQFLQAGSRHITIHVRESRTKSCCRNTSYKNPYVLPWLTTDPHQALRLSAIATAMLSGCIHSSL